MWPRSVVRFCVTSHLLVWLGKHDYTGFVNFETFQGGMFWIEFCVSIVRISTPRVLSALLMTPKRLIQERLSRRDGWLCMRLEWSKPYHKYTWWGHCTSPGITTAVMSSIQTSQLICSRHSSHSSFCSMWHLFPVISSLIDVADITIAAILSHPVRLSQEMMTCLTRSFPNELDAGYFEAPCLQSRLREMRTCWYRAES